MNELRDVAMYDSVELGKHCIGNLNLDVIPAEMTLLYKLQDLIALHFKTWRFERFYVEALGVSGKKLNSLCVLYFNASIHSLIDQRLLQEAKLLLKQSHLQCKTIAYELGFCDPGHFARWFKRVNGCAPGEYRFRSGKRVMFEVS